MILLLHQMYEMASNAISNEILARQCFTVVCDEMINSIRRRATADIIMSQLSELVVHCLVEMSNEEVRPETVEYLERMWAFSVCCVVPSINSLSVDLDVWLIVSVGWQLGSFGVVTLQPI